MPCCVASGPRRSGHARLLQALVPPAIEPAPASFSPFAFVLKPVTIGQIMRNFILPFFVVALAACGTPAPPPQLYQLRSAAPQSVAPAPGASIAVAESWQLAPLRLPEYLDRDAIVVPTGQSGLQPLQNHRWAEPLRDAVPRVLRQDLGALRGEGSIWAAPLPAGAVVARLLRVEVLAFEATADRAAVRLDAQWSLVDAAGAAPPQIGSARIEVPSVGSEPDALVAAHRLALWRLAERIAGRSGASAR